MFQGHLIRIAVGLGVGAGTVFTVKNNDWDPGTIGLVRFLRASRTVVDIAIDYKVTLYADDVDVKAPGYAEMCSELHKRSAEKLLDLCCLNRGLYIKVGQHMGALDYLLPPEYVSTMKVLHSQAPESELRDIYRVIHEDLQVEPSQLFQSFDPKPLGAASLAQVHRATLKDGREIAIKVQHPHVQAHAFVDLQTIEWLARFVAWFIPDFKFMWLVKESKRNLPRELDFTFEGRNAERVRRMFQHLPWLHVPEIYWDLTTERVLAMEFCEGGQVNDAKYITRENISASDVTRKLGLLYSEMIFDKGYVHCDPHPGNIFVRKSDDGAHLILLDHGLYATLTDDFRLNYSRLWLCLLNANISGIKHFADKLGVGELHQLFACMVTARSWNSISSGIGNKELSLSEETALREEAMRRMGQITEVLSTVNREMLLILKANDLIRGIEYSLNTHKNMSSFITMSHYCIRAVYQNKMQNCRTIWCRCRVSVMAAIAQFHIKAYQFCLWLWHSRFGNRLRWILGY